MKVLKACYALLAVACAVSLGAVAYSADEPKTEQPAAAKEEAKSSGPKDPQDEFNDLDAQRVAIAKRLNSLNREFQTADLERQKAIKQEWESSISDYQQKIQPRMVELAKQVFEKDSTKLPFGEFLVQMYIQNNQ